MRCRSNRPRVPASITDSAMPLAEAGPEQVTPGRQGAHPVREGSRETGYVRVLWEGAKGLWLYGASDDKRECPVRGRNCYPASFDSYQQMLAHCRQKHPDRLPFGGDTTTELVITDIHGKVLSWEEMRRIIDDPSFWQEPQTLVQWPSGLTPTSSQRRALPSALPCNSERHLAATVHLDPTAPPDDMHQDLYGCRSSGESIACRGRYSRP
jgi:hypothetical protein